MATYNQVNDAMKTALIKELYHGQLNDMLMQWLISEGAKGDDLMQLWRSFLNIEAIPQGEHTERLKAWYAFKGFNCVTLTDSALLYWQKRVWEQ